MAAALAAIVSTFLTLAEPEVLMNCDCDDSFRLSGMGFTVPLVAAALVELVVLGGRAPASRRAVALVRALAVIECLMTFLYVGLAVVDGPARTVVLIGHGALLALLLPRLVVRRAWCDARRS